MVSAPGWDVTCDGLASHPGGVAILLVASCYRNRIICGSYANQARDLTFFYIAKGH